jgi:hypothetical protein
MRGRLGAAAPSLHWGPREPAPKLPFRTVREPGDSTNPDAAPRGGAPDEATRERIIQLAFGGNEARYEQFLAALREVTPPDVEVILRGSAVTGTRWADGEPFDADGLGTSDLDVTFLGRDMLKFWDSFYIPALHTVPLSDEHPDASKTFTPLRRALCNLAGRPVNLQASADLVQFARDVLFEQPYVTLIEKREGENLEAAPDDDDEA